jgi:hypothetical protein
MARYFFHATDGYAAAIDVTGRRLWSRDLEDVAAEVAHELRVRFGALADLSEWLMVVNDERGETIEIFEFPLLETARDAVFAAA